MKKEMRNYSNNTFTYSLLLFYFSVDRERIFLCPKKIDKEKKSR